MQEIADNPKFPYKAQNLSAIEVCMCMQDEAERPGENTAIMSQAEREAAGFGIDKPVSNKAGFEGTTAKVHTKVAKDLAIRNFRDQEE